MRGPVDSSNRISISLAHVVQRITKSRGVCLRKRKSSQFDFASLLRILRLTSSDAVRLRQEATSSMTLLLPTNNRPHLMGNPAPCGPCRSGSGGHANGRRRRRWQARSPFESGRTAILTSLHANRVPIGCKGTGRQGNWIRPMQSLMRLISEEPISRHNAVDYGGYPAQLRGFCE